MLMALVFTVAFVACGNQAKTEESAEEVAEETVEETVEVAEEEVVVEEATDSVAVEADSIGTVK